MVITFSKVIDIDLEVFSTEELTIVTGLKLPLLMAFAMCALN